MKGNILTYALLAIGGYIVWKRFIKKNGESSPVMTTRPAVKELTDAQLKKEIDDSTIVEASMQEIGSEGAAVAEPTSGFGGWDSNPV